MGDEGGRVIGVVEGREESDLAGERVGLGQLQERRFTGVDLHGHGVGVGGGDRDEDRPGVLERVGPELVGDDRW